MMRLEMKNQIKNDHVANSKNCSWQIRIKTKGYERAAFYEHSKEAMEKIETSNALEQLTQWLYIVILTFTASFTAFFCLLIIPFDTICSLACFWKKKPKNSKGQKMSSVSVSSQNTRKAVSQFIRK